jgi:hypothetical protein
MPLFKAKVFVTFEMKASADLSEKVKGVVSSDKFGIDLVSEEVMGNVNLEAEMEMSTNEFEVQLEAKDADEAEEIIREKLGNVSEWESHMDFESYVDVEVDEISIDVTIISVEEINSVGEDQ